MKLQLMLRSISILLILAGCQSEDHKNSMDDLNSIKKEFLNEIVSEEVIESPFHIIYKLKTVFFSREVVSLFGEISVYNHLPHGWRTYEGKTLCKINGQFQQVTLKDLFVTENQKEFLRSYCEDNLKFKNEQPTFFSGDNPLFTHLDLKNIHTFVVDHQSLIIIFQPYYVGGCGDGPFIVKIPYENLKGRWNSAHPLIPILNRTIKSKSFTSSWEEGKTYFQDEAVELSVF